MRVLAVFLLFMPLLLACEKEAEEFDPCADLAYSIEGTYNITVTSYSLQPFQVGDEKEVLVFAHLYACYEEEPQDKILFNNLFGFFDCTVLTLVDNNTFTVTYEDGDSWFAAPIRGDGSIIDEVFHFEGFVMSSGKEHPIVLDGVKISQDRRTDAC